MDAPNELAAIHEAAHAVIRGYHFGHEIGETWINEERGNCQFRMPDRGDTVLFEDIAGCLAGRIAEDHLLGARISETEWRATGDHKRAFDCALRLNAGDTVGAELLLVWLSRRTRLLVAKLSPQIQTVAYALLEREKLSGREITAILNGA